MLRKTVPDPYKNVFNERLKDSSLHVGSRRSADSEFQVVGPEAVKDRRPSELSQ